MSFNEKNIIFKKRKKNVLNFYFEFFIYKFDE